METSKVLIRAVLVAAIAFAGSASAQSRPLTPYPPAPAYAAAPAPAQASTPAHATPASDIEQFYGRLALGYYGAQGVPIAGAVIIGDNVNYVLNRDTSALIAAPLVGARYWLQGKPAVSFLQAVGVDVALGWGTIGGNSTTIRPNLTGGTTTTSTDYPAAGAFVFQLGVPLVLSSMGHAAFEIIPEIRYGHAGSTLKQLTPGSPPAVELSGNVFDIGARAGLEVFFGFMGLPQLALEGTVGLSYEYANVHASAGSQSFTDSGTGFQTTVQGSPWDIFTGSIAARYYF